MRWGGLVLLVSMLAAGCLSSPSPASEAPSARPLAQALGLAESLPCAAEVGEGTSANIQRLGKVTFPPGDTGEVDIRDDLALVSRNRMGGCKRIVATMSEVGQNTLKIHCANDRAWSLQARQFGCITLGDPAQAATE